VSDFFFMLGEPLSGGEKTQVKQYLGGLGIGDELPIDSVPNFKAAAQVLTNPEWDRRWWDAEQREKDRLFEAAKAQLGENELVRVLSETLEATESVHGAAAVEAARRDCSDAALIRVAAGAVSQSLHLAKLAELAGEGDTHPFMIKAALFAGGHWPLGIVNGRYWVF
jgi:hypothetical protein